MDLTRKLELLDGQIAAAKDGVPDNLEDWRAKTRTVLLKLFGPESHEYVQFTKISYSPGIWTERTDWDPYIRNGVNTGISYLEAAKIAATLDEEMSPVPNASAKTASVSAGAIGTIFIVHGHDVGRKLEVQQFLHRLTGKNPTILSDKPNKGATLIEKFETNAEQASYAVFLMTADDMGRAKADAELKPRSRQNVVFEAGYFIAKLGRQNVALLLEPGVEEIGDISGIVYIPVDSCHWKAKLAQEIEAAGIPVKWEALSPA